MNKNIVIKLSLLLLVVVSKINLSAQEHGKWVIGHGDLTADYVDSEWVFSFHHEDEDHDQTLVLDQHSRNEVPNVERFSFLGQPGRPVWIIPQISTEGIPFMGFNSHLTPKGIFQQDSFNVNLTSVDGPGDFFIWASSIDGIDVSYNSGDGLGELDVMEFPARGHFHKNLGFNSPGTHLLGFTATGVLADSGLTTKSEEYFVKYEVNVLSEGEVDLEIVYEDGKLGAEILAVVHDDHGDDEHGDDDHGDDDHGDDDHGDDDHGDDDHGDDDHEGHHHDGLVYPVNEVALRVKTKSVTLVPNDPDYSFLGKPGDLVYELPQNHEKGLLFFGIGADELEKGVFVNDEVQLNLKSVEGPGNIYLYAPDIFDPPTVMFNSADGINESDTFTANVGVCAHQSMVFSKAGIYRVGLDISGKLAANGNEIRSEKFELLFEVEEVTILSEGEVDLEIVYEEGQWAAELLTHAVEEGDDHGDDHGDEDGDDHGDEDGDDHGAFEWAGVFSVADSTHTWSMQQVGGKYADPTMRLVLIPTDAPTAETMESLEEKAEGLITGDVYQVIEVGEVMKPAAGGTCFELHVGAGADSTFTIDTSGITGLAIYAQHVPTEFERDRHYLYDSKGTDIEPIAQEGGGGHHHHHHGDMVMYAPSDVLLLVESKAAKLIPSDPAFGFLGQAGDLFYELPQHEEEGLLFLGIATDELEEGIFAGDQVQMNLKSVDGPGHVYLYATDTFGSPVVMFNSADGISEADKFVTKAGAHAHQSMAFSEPGTYRVGFDFSGKLAANGEETRSEKFELLFEVEEADHDDDSHGQEDLAISTYSIGASPFSLSFETKAGLTYEIEATHDLKKWEEIGEVKGNGGSVDFIDQREALFNKQYYRIKIK